MRDGLLFFCFVAGAACTTWLLRRRYKRAYDRAFAYWGRPVEKLGFYNVPEIFKAYVCEN
jgi:hypothetical protein